MKKVILKIYNFILENNEVIINHSFNGQSFRRSVFFLEVFRLKLYNTHEFYMTTSHNQIKVDGSDKLRANNLVLVELSERIGMPSLQLLNNTERR